MNATSPLFLTPSEQVYLNGEQFASHAGVFNKTQLVHTDLAVNQVQLAQAALSAAFLILEQQGTLRLAVRQKKALFGLASSKALFVDSCGPAAAWPQQTVEAVMPGLAYQLAMDKNKNEIDTLIYVWLGQDSGAPFEEVFMRMKWALAARGLLETRQETRLKIFKTTVFSYPEATRQLAAQQPPQPVRQLFDACQQTRPEVWKMLNDGIKKGISLRQEQTDTGSD